MIRLRLFGGFEAATDHPVGLVLKKARAILTLLALGPGRPQSRDRLIRLLWSGSEREPALTSLRQVLTAIRQALGDAEARALLTDRTTVALDPEAVEVDALAFERLIRAGTPESRTQAVDLYRGPLLDGLVVGEQGFDEWLVAERERLHAVALDALDDVLLRAEADDPDTAVATALRLVALDPVRETAHRTLMRLYAARGQHAAALRQYEVCAAALHRELRVQPDTATRRLYKDLLRHRGHGGDSAPPALPERELLPVPPAYDTRLVGREAEMRRLRTVLDEAAGGLGSTVALLGEVGIGKSRCLGELVAEAEGRGMITGTGRAHDAERILPLGPWAEALRAALQAARFDAAATLDSTARAELGRLLPERAERRLPAARGNLLRLFEAVADVTAALARQRPVLLVLEDFHRADATSVQLLSFLSRRLDRHPVVVAFSARSDELHDVPTLARSVSDLARDRRLVRLTLGPLSHDDTVTLVTALAAERRAAELAVLADRVWELSRGQPFMAVEALRALEEIPALADASRLRLPDRIRDVVAARLDHLSRTARHLAEVAAVVGRPIEFQLLQRASGLSGDDASAGVEELARRQIVHGVGDEIDFTHDRLRQVAYEHIPPGLRREFHARVGDAMESLRADGGGAPAATLAVHFREGARWEQAVRYFREAGGDAMSRSAYREAQRCFEHALAGTAHLRESPATLEHAIDVRLELRAALVPFAELDRALELLQAAHAIAERLGDQRRLGQVLSGLAYSHWNVGQHDRAIAAARRALEIADGLGDAALHCEAAIRLGHAYFALGEYGAARAVLDEAVTSAAEPYVWSRGAVAFTLSSYWLALTLAELGEFEAAEATAAAAIARAEAREHPYGLAEACVTLGAVLVHRRKADQAVTVLERAAALLASEDYRLWQPRVRALLAVAYAEAGRGDEARPHLAAAAGDPETARDTSRAALIAVLLGRASLALERPGDAARFARRALDLAGRFGERGTRARALLLLADVVARGPGRWAPNGEALYDEALATARELGMRGLEAECRFGRARLLERLGRVEPARRESSEAIALGAAIGMTGGYSST